MITLLARIFIREDDKPEKVRLAYGILCGIVGILLNVLLFTGKFIAGTISKSIAITADAFNNLSDAGSSIVTLLGFKLGAAKPDPGASIWTWKNGIRFRACGCCSYFNYGSGTDTGFHQKDSSSGSNGMLCINYRDSADIDCCKAVYDLLQQGSRKED